MLDRIPTVPLSCPAPVSRFASHHPRPAFPSLCRLNTYSFHIGAASTTGALGVSPSVIHTSSNWMGNSYRCYVQLLDKYVFHAQLQMLTFAKSEAQGGQGMALACDVSRERSHIRVTTLLGFSWPATDTVKQVHWL